MGLEYEKQFEQLELDVGQDLTLKQFANLLHNENDGYVTLAKKNEKGEWNERTYFINDWLNHLEIDSKISLYNSVNTFYKPKRGNENVRHLTALYVDLDVYDVGISKQDAIDGIDFLVKTERLFEPSLIVDSGRGLYAYWIIESAPGKFKNVQKLYSHIENFIIEMTKELGSDHNACDMSRVLKVPGTFNPKSNTKVKVLRHSKKSYTLRLFQELMNDVNGVDWSIDKKDFIRTEKPKKQKRKKKSTIKRLFNFYTLAVQRSRDLETLCRLRNYSIYGYLNSLLHIYCYQMMLIHKDHYVARHLTKELNESLKYQLSNQEIKDLSKSVYKAYQLHLKDSNKGYNYKNSTIIKKLNITSVEQREMRTLISQAHKREREYENRRKSRRDKRGLTARQAKKQELFRQVQRMITKGFKQIEIAKEIGISKGRVSQIVKQINKV